jgi:hypothetical protein
MRLMGYLWTFLTTAVLTAAFSSWLLRLIQVHQQRWLQLLPVAAELTKKLIKPTPGFSLTVTHGHVL